MTPRVAIAVPTLEGGGFERMAVLLASGLAKRGEAVDLVMLRREGPYVDQVDPGVRQIELGAARAARAVRPLRRYYTAERPAAIFCMGMEMSFAATLAALLPGRSPRVVWGIRNATSGDLAQMPSPTRQIWRTGLKLLAPRAAAVVANSRGVAEDFRSIAKVPPERLLTIHNAVAAHAPGPPPPLLARLKAEGPVVVAVGRLTEQKNHALLIDAFADVAGPTGAALVILGEGPLRPRLEARAAERGVAARVHLPGFVERPWNWIAAADAFVLSSRYEGLPNALLEAMTTGTPVIATDCPHGPREILEDGRWGRLVPNGDRAALAEAIRATLREGGVDARPRAGDFSHEAFISRHAEVLGLQG